MTLEQYNSYAQKDSVLFPNNWGTVPPQNITFWDRVKGFLGGEAENQANTIGGKVRNFLEGIIPTIKTDNKIQINYMPILLIGGIIVFIYFVTKKKRK